MLIHQRNLFGEEYAKLLQNEVENLGKNINSKIQENENLFFAIVGMPGSGKSLVTDYLRNKFGEENWVRFGQPTLDIYKILEDFDKNHNRKLQKQEEYEKAVRELIRAKYGMDAFAKINMHKFEEVLKRGNLIGDGLYSWEELTYLKEKYRKRLFVISVHAGASVRYARLVNRKKDMKDPDFRFRNFSLEQAKARDINQMMYLNTAPPIAYSDYPIKNHNETIKEVYAQIEDMLNELKNGKE